MENQVERQGKNQTEQKRGFWTGWFSKCCPVSIDEELITEIEAMVRHLQSSGKEVRPEVFRQLDLYKEVDDDKEPGRRDRLKQDLVVTHADLSGIVAPALPGTLRLLEQERQRHPVIQAFGPVSIIRWFVVIALITLAMFLWMGNETGVFSKALSEVISTEGTVADSTADSTATEAQMDLTATDAEGNNGSSQGNEETKPSIWYTGLFLLSAAGMGSTFLVLTQLSKFVVNRTYQPKYATSYKIRFILGLMAGMILALFRFDSLGFTNVAITGPLLAVVGGFSAQAVYRILQRVTYAIESVVRGDVEEIIVARIQAETERLNAQKAKEKAELATKVTDVKEIVRESTDGNVKKDILGELDKLIR